MKHIGLDNYYDLITILGKVSVLVEQYYYNFVDEQLDSIDCFYETILFHIENRSSRRTILSELEAMIRFIDGELKQMNL